MIPTIQWIFPKKSPSNIARKSPKNDGISSQKFHQKGGRSVCEAKTIEYWLLAVVTFAAFLFAAVVAW